MTLGFTKGWWFSFLSVVPMLLAWVIFAVKWEGEPSRWTSRSWRGSPLSQYNGYVPEFALSKAVGVKELLPSSEFKVEYLVEERREYRSPRASGDPFLLVTLGNEKFYLDVWDESEFERRLL